MNWCITFLMCTIWLPLLLLFNGIINLIPFHLKWCQNLKQLSRGCKSSPLTTLLSEIVATVKLFYNYHSWENLWHIQLLFLVLWTHQKESWLHWIVLQSKHGCLLWIRQCSEGNSYLYVRLIYFSPDNIS